MAALTLLLGLQMNAQTIHWLTFIDTTDSDVGQIASAVAKCFIAAS